MQNGEGMLAGNSSSGMFLVHAETSENPYVDPRPFRVNAGGVHAYTMVPGGKTKYLADLKAGDQSLVVNHRGEAYASVVGRVKIERRPMLMVSAVHDNAAAALVLQNAETIRLVSPSGKPVSVVELKKGDAVLGHIESAGRHFGMKVRETILEK
jgi:3-dehydroquinate synthase II